MSTTNNTHSLTYDQLSGWWAELIGCRIALEGIADSVDTLIETTTNPAESIQQLILSVQRRLDIVVGQMDHPATLSGPVPMTDGGQA